MRKLTKILTFVFTVLVFYFFLFNIAQYKERGEEIYSSVFPITEKDTAWIENKLRNMTLEEKCAQLIMVYADSRDTSAESKDIARLTKLVKELKIGGVIFFKGEIDKQVYITNKLQSESETPLLIASDFERGLGMRLTDAVEFPTNMAIAAANQPKLTYLMGKVIGIEARKIGVHQNYAPAVDINHDYRNPIINYRAFSDEPGLTVKHSKALIRGMEKENLIATVKHFPGHGGTDLDSHKELPLISRTFEEYETSDLIPFEEAIKAKVKSVMVAHLEVPAYEEQKGLPATLSPSIVHDLLVNRLGFDGLIVTDALNMHAISGNYTQEESVLEAIQAGNDVLLFPEDDSAAVKGLVDAVKDYKLTEERIDASVRKILTAKKWLGLDTAKFVDTANINKTLHAKDHWRLSREIADKSITLLKNDKNLIPIKPVDYYATALITMTDYNSKQDNSSEFQKLAEEKFNYIQSFELHSRSRKKDYRSAMNFAKKANLIIVPLFLTVRSFYGSIGLSDNNKDFLEDLIALKKPMVVVSMGNPYAIKDFKDVQAYLTSYGTPKVSQEAAFAAMTGNADITGRLPITIPETDFIYGDGIQLKYNQLQNFKLEQDSLYDFSKIDSLMSKAIEDSVFPGAVLMVGHHGKVVLHKPYGHYTYDESSREMQTDAIFDLASVSKVIGTTSAAMLLSDQGKLDINEKVVHYLPEFDNHGKDIITVRNLLEHNAGFTAWKPFYKDSLNADQIIAAIMNCELEYEPGTKYVYSDWSMITLQQIIQRITGKSLDLFLKENVFDPMGMKHTMYNPPPEDWFYCVPTEVDNYFRMTTMKGKVHDEVAYSLNGVAGHAGLFSTASDLGKFMQMMLNHGRYGDLQLFKASTIENWTTKQTDLSTRALGWDTRSIKGSSSGHLFSMHSFGHTGFTGTSVWADKDNDLFVVLLTNRVYPTRENRKIIRFRPIIHDAIFKALKYSFEAE